MTLTNDQIAYYFNVSAPTASKLKKEILNFLGKTSTRITACDLAKYEGISITDMLELLNLKPLKKTA